MKRKRVLSLLLAAMLAITPAYFPIASYVVAAESNDENSGISLTKNKTFDVKSSWDDIEFDFDSLTTAEEPKNGTAISFDLLLPADAEHASDFSGVLKAQGVFKLGNDWKWTESKTIPEFTSSQTEDVTIDGKNYKKKSFTIPFDQDEIKATGGAVKSMIIKIAGWQCNYSGDLTLSNVKIVEPEKSEEDNTPASLINAKTISVSYDTASNWDSKDVSYGDITTEDTPQNGTGLSLDILLPKDDTNADSFQGYIKAKGVFKIGSEWKWTEADNIPEFTKDEFSDVTIDGIEYRAVTAKFTFSNNQLTDSVNETDFQIVGSGCDYKGDIILSNPKIIAPSETPAEEDTSVNSTIAVDSAKPAVSVNASGKTITLTGSSDGTAKTYNLSGTNMMVDKDATENTKYIYSYLKAVGESDSIIYGHQNDTSDKAGSAVLSNSDTKDVTGSISGVCGLDALSLTGDEFSASKYNSTRGGSLPTTPAGNVKAAALLTNENISEGAIQTLSAHMPNFSVVKENPSYNAATDPTYAKYDFSGYSPNNLNGDVANQILPGGQYNDKFNAYLDMIADYAHEVNGTVLFRPFHENTGSWFWWGAAFCDASTYKNIYRYTVTYLRDVKGVHNFIYVYGPGSEAGSVEEYAERYPGDAYVDMVGFDMYHRDPAAGDGWFKNFRNEANIVEAFAAQHNKLFAVTETGMATSTADKGESQTALHKTGNNIKDWYEEILNALDGSHASYFLTWANFSKTNGYYSPFVDSVNEDGTLRGHEMLDDFISFYNDKRTIFATNQKAALSSNVSGITAKSVSSISAFIESPAAGFRVLDETTISSYINAGSSEISGAQYILSGKEKTLTLDAAIEANRASAKLTKEDLDSLGEGVGTLSLIVDGMEYDKISLMFNMQAPAEDPYEIDDFENYYGVDSLLQKNWTSNKDSGCSVSFTLSKDEKYSGDYALKFSYDETAKGWGGATISKNVDWTDCNALSFWTIPDVNNQKTVIQITANGNVYETYLNLYEGYAKSTKPLKVTIPFSEFVARDIAGNPKGGLENDKAKISSFGLWVNAIGDSPQVKDGRVSGTLYYDKITAIKTDKTKASFESDAAASSGAGDNKADTSTKTAPSNSTGSTSIAGSASNGSSNSGTTGGDTVAGNSVINLTTPTEEENIGRNQVSTVVVEPTINPDGTINDGGIKHNSEFVQKDVEKVQEAVAKQNKKKSKSSKKKATNVTIDMTDGALVSADLVPKEVLSAVKGQNVNVKFDMGSYSWTINGNDLKNVNLRDINFGIIFDSNPIDSDIMKTLSGKNDSTELTLKHSGEFLFKARLTINAGKKYKNKYANFYTFNEAGHALSGYAKVNGKGNVTVDFNHGGDYGIVFTKKHAKP